MTLLELCGGGDGDGGGAPGFNFFFPKTLPKEHSKLKYHRLCVCVLCTRMCYESRSDLCFCVCVCLRLPHHIVRAACLHALHECACVARHSGIVLP